MEMEQCGTVQASYGCLVVHVCMGVRISDFNPQLSNSSVSGFDEHADKLPIIKIGRLVPCISM